MFLKDDDFTADIIYTVKFVFSSRKAPAGTSK
jgi:hypothetical protein